MITEKRTITADDLRTMCVMHEWFTGGTIADYESMFETWCNINLTTTKIEDLAQYIIDHSDYVRESLIDVMYSISYYSNVKFYEM